MEYGDVRRPAFFEGAPSKILDRASLAEVTGGAGAVKALLGSAEEQNIAYDQEDSRFNKHGIVRMTEKTRILIIGPLHQTVEAIRITNYEDIWGNRQCETTVRSVPSTFLSCDMTWLCNLNK